MRSRSAVPEIHRDGRTVAVIASGGLPLPQLASGIDQLASGAGALGSGLGTIASSTSQAAGGAAQLAAAQNQIADGLDAAPLPAAANTMYGYMQSAATGTVTVAQGAGALAVSLISS